MNGKPIFTVYQSKAWEGRGQTLAQQLAGVVEQSKVFRAFFFK